MTHTPGPWRVELNFLGARVVHGMADDDGKQSLSSDVRLMTKTPGSDPEGLANCHLAAAAPDLFDALRELLFLYDDLDSPEYIAAERALNKATGRGA